MIIKDSFLQQVENTFDAVEAKLDFCNHATEQHNCAGACNTGPHITRGTIYKDSFKKKTRRLQLTRSYKMYIGRRNKRTFFKLLL